MKVYVISNVEGNADKIVQILDDFELNIVSKESQQPVEKIAKTIGAIVQEDGAQLIILSVNDPIKANILLNKQSEVRAAICSSERELALAKRNNVNVIIVGDVLDEQLLAQAVAERGKNLKTIVSIAKKKVAAFRPIKETEEPETKVEREDKEEEMEDAQVDPEKWKKMSLVQKIKDSLGIVDK